ncbi:MAG TPA: phosphoribosylaminoimidazole synthetase [Campylobacterales bacterium]|nr:phosphoribosylaminoimidazole synthetase [Campylobacterales bacterium]
MCAEKIQRILSALMLGIILYFFATGSAQLQAGAESSFNFQVAVILQFLVIVMILVRAFTNLCPSLTMIQKAFPPCDWKK